MSLEAMPLKVLSVIYENSDVPWSEVGGRNPQATVFHEKPFTKAKDY